MTCAGRSRSRSLALLVSARTCCTWSSGKVLAITPRLIRSLRRMPAGRPERARAIVAARPRESASMTQLHHYVNSIALSLDLAQDRVDRRFARQTVQVEATGEHRQGAVRRPRPFGFRPVPVQLDPVPVRVTQVERLANAVIAGAVERYSGGGQAAQGIRERGSRRVEDGEVEQA